jgi:D-lactate dehydrogenase (cytochrome)
MMVRGVNLHSKLGLAEAPTLFFEFHGSEAGVAEQATLVGELARDFGAAGFEWATRPEDRTRLWAARHDAFWATRELRPGAEARATDVCVPISRLAECILETRADIDANGLVAPVVGHVGDGNFHLTFLVDPNDEGEVARAEAVNHRMIDRALAMGGTCTGEHGVGTGKMPYLEQEHPEGIGLMRRIKRALDPENILNPGKVIRL